MHNFTLKSSVITVAFDVFFVFISKTLVFQREIVYHIFCKMSRGEIKNVLHKHKK